MANEIYQCYDNALVLYALIWRASDSYIYNADAAALEASEGELVYFEGDVLTWEGEIVTVGDWAEQLLECDVPLTAYGFSHFADFPAVAAGSYIVEIRKRTSTTPAIDDVVVGQGFMEWSGSSEILRATLNSKIDIIDTLVDSLTTNLATANTNISAVLLALNKVYNVYPAPTPEQYNPLGRL
jgi:hypothetical protein